MEKESRCCDTTKVEKGNPSDKGKYVKYNVLGNLFQVSSTYVPPVKLVGSGAYGIVWYNLSRLSVSLPDIDASVNIWFSLCCLIANIAF